MMADSVEAASRTLVDPTPARIRTLVENIIKGIYAERQLDETELTFRDISKIIESFSRILTGLFHQRIVYPKCDILPHGGEGASVPGVRNDSAGEAGEASASPVLPESGSVEEADRTSANSHAPGQGDAL